MGVNPLLKKLGFSNDARVVIIHADDIGMCQASVGAFEELFDFGLVSCGATMVPCPWFPAGAALCRRNPRIDMGVHLTLNSEWDGYRWGPLSTRDPASGLLDAEGYMHRRQAPVQEQADAAAVAHEITAQVERARQAGIDITHVDTHMGTVAHMKFVASYLQLALEQHVPAMIPRLDEAGFRARGLDAETAALVAGMIAALEAQGLPLVDAMASLPLEQPAERIERAKHVLSGLPVGITHFIIHPSQDTPELRAITADWQGRVADFEVFRDEGLRRWVKDSGLQVIGYRLLKTVMPTSV